MKLHRCLGAWGRPQLFCLDFLIGSSLWNFWVLCHWKLIQWEQSLEGPLYQLPSHKGVGSHPQVLHTLSLESLWESKKILNKDLWLKVSFQKSKKPHLSADEQRNLFLLEVLNKLQVPTQFDHWRNYDSFLGVVLDPSPLFVEEHTSNKRINEI